MKKSLCILSLLASASLLPITGVYADESFTAAASLYRTNDAYTTPAVNFPGNGTYPITVSAKGTICGGGWPIMKVNVGSEFTATKAVSTTSWQNFIFNAKLKAGSEPVTVTFTNDCYIENSDGTYQDRNLYINTVTVSGVTASAPPASAPVPAAPVSAPPVSGILSAPVNAVPALTAIPATPGTVWYVSAQKGSDSNDGRSLQTPFQTIGRAIYSQNTKFNGGDVVVVMPGTYNETLRFTPQIPGTAPGSQGQGAAGGTATAYTTVMGMPGQPRPVIVGNQQNQFYSCNTCSAIQVQAPYVRISGLDVSAPGQSFFGTGINVAGANAPTQDANGVYHSSVHHVIIDNNIVHDSGSAGIGVSSVDYVTVQNNIVYNNTNWDPGQTSGIDILTLVDYDNAPGYHVQILNNVAYNNVVQVPIGYISQSGIVETCPSSQPNCHSDGNGIIVDSNNIYGYKSSILILGNMVYDNGARGITVYNSLNPVDIVNNTSYHNIKDTNLTNYPSGAGAELEDLNDGNVRYYNNIAVPLDVQHEALCICSNTAAPFKYNLTEGGFSYFGNGVSSPDSSNKIGVDPQFVAPSTNPSSNNFCLKSGSPALAAGTALGYAFTDINGHAIAAGQQPNLGACLQ